MTKNAVKGGAKKDAAVSRTSGRSSGKSSSGKSSSTAVRGATSYRQPEKSTLRSAYVRLEEQNIVGVARSVALPPGTVAPLKNSITKCLAKVEESRERAQSDLVEIKRLKTETRKMIAKLMAAA